MENDELTNNNAEKINEIDKMLNALTGQTPDEESAISESVNDDGNELAEKSVEETKRGETKEEKNVSPAEKRSSKTESMMKGSIWKKETTSEEKQLKDEVTKKETSTKEQSEKPKQVIPDLLQTAMTVPNELLTEVAKYKRDLKNDLDNKNLVWAIGDEVATFKVNGIPMQVLKLHLELNDVPVYVFQKQAGINCHSLNSFIGRKTKLGIYTMLETNRYDEQDNMLYIALGSIQEAEFVVGGQLFSKFEHDPESVKDEKRIGLVTHVLDTPSKQLVFFTYNGIHLVMLAKDFYYQTWSKPLKNEAYVGLKFEFRITDIVRTTYEKQLGIQENAKGGKDYINPTGTMYRISTSRLSFLPSPEAKVEDLYKREACFLAHVVGYDAVKGIRVEIAPGWTTKGILKNTSPFKPSVQDAIHHTPVTVQIQSLDMENRTGRCNILNFPQGVVRVLDPTKC